MGEVALAARLGVSRTPVREALLELERDGLVRSERGRGFTILPLTPDDAREIYPIIWTLERLALQQTKAVSAAMTRRLQAVNDKLKSARSPLERVRLDTEWHQLLVSSCRNDRLLAIIAATKRSIERYEYAYLARPHFRDRSADEHDQLLAIVGTDIPRAAAKLEDHWRDGMNSVIQALTAE